MGWCSATEIMDMAVKAAEDAVSYTLVNPEKLWQNASTLGPMRSELQDSVDGVLRPFVAAIAEKLRDGDWDCIEESDYFDRFPREMLGYDDREWEEWLAEQINTSYDRDKRRAYMRMLEEFYEGQASDG